MKIRAILSAVVILAVTSVFAELRISEICPRPDAKDPNGKESGWIELWNDGSEAVDLADYEIVRVNRGKALKSAGKPLASRTVPAGGYTVVYTSEEYDNADSGDVVTYANDVMVYPNKISPKKFPLIALYKGSELLEQFIIPVDLADNKSIAPAGGAFPAYAGETAGGTPGIAVDAEAIDITSALSIDADSGVTLTDGVYDFSAVTALKKGLKASASIVTAALCATNTWSAKFSFKLNTKKASKEDGGSPLFFCRTSASAPKSGVVVFINNAGLIRCELRDANGGNGKKFDVDTDIDWYDSNWHEMKIVSSGNCMSRFVIAIDGVTYIDTTYGFNAALRSDVPVCFGHAYDSTYWDLFDGQIKDISFYTGTLVGRDAVSGDSVGVNDSLSIADASAVSRVILPVITKGAANNRYGESAYGPNAGPLYGIKHSYSDWQAWPLAQIGVDYPVTLAVNPMTTNAVDEITGVTLLYRADFGTIGTVAMTKGSVVAGQGQLWTANIPASALPAAGHLIRWAAQITDHAGNVWRSPSFRNPDDGYEWYGTIVEPTSEQVSATLQTWHIFADSTALSKMDSQYDSIRASTPLGARVCIFDSQTSNYYDNVRIDLRGNTTAGMNKKSHGLKFSKVHPMTCVNPFDGEKIECRKTSLLAEFADMSRVRSSLSMYLRRLAGQDVPFGYPIRVQLNGAFYQLDHHTNRFTDELLTDYYGYDEYGYAWKNVGTAGGGNTSGGMDQTLPDDGTNVESVYKDFTTAIAGAKNYTYNSDGLDATTSNALNKAVVKLYDMPAWINFLALSRFTQECDDGWANLCLYYDRLGTGTWRPLAYDLHQSLGAYYAADGYTNPARNGLWAEEDVKGKSHPFYGGCHVVTERFQGDTDKGNRAFEAVYQNAKYRRLHNRRLRTLMDKIMMAPGTSQADTPFWHDYVEPMVAAMQADDVLDRNKWPVQTGLTIYVWSTTLNFAQGVQDLWDNYFVRRRNHFFNTHSITNTAFAGGYARDKNAEIPLAQSATTELAAGISVVPVVGGAVIRNLNEETIDMSGWKLKGALKYTFPAGSVIDRAFGTTAGEIFVVSNRIEYIEANDATLTDQIILGNAKAGVGEAFELEDADGVAVIAPPEPEVSVFSGDYNDLVTINTAGSYVFSNANLNAGLEIAAGITVKINAATNTINTISAISAAASEVRFTGDGTVKLEGADTLMSVLNLVVKSGVLEVKSTGVAATKTPVVNVAGYVEQTGGTIDMDLDVATTNQIYGIYVANKNTDDEYGNPTVYAMFDGGRFDAVVGGTKSAAVYINKGSVDTTFKGGETLNVTLTGGEARFVNASGKLDFKRCTATVGMPEQYASVVDARVFKSDKKITITDGHYNVNVPETGAEIFSSADEITISGGTFELAAGDDCFSALNRITVNGGLFYAVSLANDVFDSNGDMEINGGTILAYATAEGHEAFDVDPELTEEGKYAHQLRIYGGTIFATGGKDADWPDNLVTTNDNLYVEEDLAAADYSGKYFTIKSSLAETTAKLPAFPQSGCAVLAFCPEMKETVETSATAPADGDQHFHDLYIEMLVQTYQSELRFLEIYGNTTTDGGDTGEYIVLTNVSDNVVLLEGLKVNVEKLADWTDKGESSSKCLFTLVSGTVPAHGTVRFDQATYWNGNKQKITNGEIYIALTDAAGETIQSGTASFDDEKYPGVDGGGASLIAISFGTEMQDTTEYWKTSIPPVVPGPDPEGLGAFAYSASFTVNGYTGSSTLERFPVLVRISEDSPAGFAYTQLSEDGSDLRFGDAEANPLSFEIEKWDPSGESLIWVSIPAMTNGYSFTMFYGGTPMVENYPTNVWTDYVGVWHMTEASGPVADSTGHGLTATPKGANSDDCIAVTTGGPAGNARQLATAKAQKTYLEIPNYDSFGLGGNFTIQGWFKATECYSSYSARYFSRKNSYNDTNGWEVEQRYADNAATPETTVSCRGGNDGNAVQTVPSITSAWLDLALNYNGSKVQYYVNGSAGDQISIAAATDNGKVLTIGNCPTGNESNWVGQMDEIRLRGGDVTADRMCAEHETIASASFLTIGAVQDLDLTIPILGEVMVSTTTSNATISAEIIRIGEGATACDVYLALNGGAAVKIATDVTTSFEYVIAGLTSSTTYDYVVSISNNAETVKGAEKAGSFTTDFDVGEGFAKQIEFTIGGFTGESTLVNFPVLVKLSTSITNFKYADCPQDSIRFFDADGNALPFEVDTWNTSGTSFIWVSVPEITGTTTKFTMYYGGIGAQRQHAAGNVWTSAGYKSVWHMDIASNSTSDSATPTNTASVLNPNEYCGAGTGLIGGGYFCHQNWYGSSAMCHGLRAPETAGASFVPTTANTFTYVAWVRQVGGYEANKAAVGYESTIKWGAWGNCGTIWHTGDNDGKKGSGLGLGIESGKNSSTNAFAVIDKELDIRPEIADLYDSAWHQVVARYDGGTLTIWVDGQKMWTKEGASYTSPAGSKVYMGARKDSNSDCVWTGDLDEMRFRDAASSDDWIAAEYANVMTDTFVTPGAVRALDHEDPVLGNLTVVARAAKATISGSIIDVGDGATACDVYLAYGTDENNLGTAQLLGSDVTGDFEYVVTDLSASTTYFYALSISNNAETVKGDVKSGSFTTEAAPVPPAFGEVQMEPKATAVVVIGSIASVGNDGATACDVYLKLGDGETMKIAEGVTDAFDYKLLGLVTNTTYSYTLSISNNAETVRGASISGSFTTLAVDEDLQPVADDPAATRNLIQEAIDAAAAAIPAGTVVLGEGLFEIDAQLMVTNGVTLQGAGYDKTVIKQTTSGTSARCVQVKSGAKLVGVTLTGGSLTGNWNYGAGALVDHGTISWCCISNNVASGNNLYGAGITIDGDAVIDHTIIADNHATGMTDFGGGIGCNGKSGTVLIDTCLVYGNTANNSGNGGGYGGGIAFRGGSTAVEIRNSTITGNSAFREGGGVYFNIGTVKLVNTIVSGNLVNGSAGDVSGTPAAGSEGNLIGGNPAFVDAENGDYHLGDASPAVGTGAAYVGSEGNVDLDHDAFAVPPSAGCYEYKGTGIEPEGTAAETRQTIQDAIDAVAPVHGTVHLGEGIFEIDEHLNLTNGVTLVGSDSGNTVIKQATPGHSDQAYHVIKMSGNAVLERIAITGGNLQANNDNCGAGVLLTDGGRISWCVITNNAAIRGYGGGVCVSGSGSFKIDHTVISENSASTFFFQCHGGGICVKPASGNKIQLEIDTCLVSGNWVGAAGKTCNGGAIAILSGGSSVSTVIRNTTIAGNDNIGIGVCGGLYVEQPDTTLVNCIIAGNTAETTTSDENVTFSSDAVATAVAARSAYCYFGGTTTPFGYAAKSESVDGAVGFVDAANGDYHLTANSPAVAAGAVRTDGEVDLDKVAFAASTSIGCYEYASNVPAPKFTPASGTKFQTQLEVRINGQGTVRYTTDGSLPTESSPVYGSAITISDTAQFKARAYVEGVASAVASATYVKGAADAGDYYVSTTGSDFADGLTPATAFRTVAHAVEVADAGQKVTVLPGTFEIGETIVIDKAITVTGSGWDETIIKPSTGKEIRLVILDNGAKLEGVTLTGGIQRGNIDSPGAAAWVKNGTISWCCVTNNNGSAQTGNPNGAAVSFQDGQGTIDHCIVANNVCGLYVYGAIGAFNNTGPVVVDTCLVYGNTAGHSGYTNCGGVGFKNPAADVTIRNCTVVGNQCGSNGKAGGIAFDSASATCTVVNTIATGNTKGGAECNFFDNRAASVQNCFFGLESDLPASAINTTYGTAMFADSVHGDYHPVSDWDAVIGGGRSCEGLGETLDGVPFNDPPSIGCYESASGFGKVRFDYPAKHVGTATVQLLGLGDGATTADVTFQYGPDAEHLCAPIAVTNGVGATTDIVATMTGLNASCEYSYRFTATDDLDNTYVRAGTFTTHDWDTLQFSTVKASPTSAGADVSVTIMKLGLGATKATVYVQWGVDFEHLCSPVRISTTATEKQMLSYPITGLANETEYVVRFSGENDIGDTATRDGVFTTLEREHLVLGEPKVSDIGRTSASIAVTVPTVGEGASSARVTLKSWIDGTTDTNTTVMSVAALRGTSLRQQLSGLTANTLYRYEIEAVNDLDEKVSVSGAFMTDDPAIGADAFNEEYPTPDEDHVVTYDADDAGNPTSLEPGSPYVVVDKTGYTYEYTSTVVSGQKYYFRNEYDFRYNCSARIGDTYYLFLSDAVDAAAAGARIELLRNNYAIGRTMQIDRSLTIEGNGYAVKVAQPFLGNDGYVNPTCTAAPKNVFRIVTGGDVTIEDMLVMGGGEQLSTGSAGSNTANEPAIVVDGTGVLEMDHVTVKRSQGGLWIAKTAKVHLNACNLVKNARYCGGGFYSLGVLVMENSSLSENRSLSSGGGGAAAENQGLLVMNNCVICNNGSTEYGGAINNLNNQSASGILYMMNMTMAGNFSSHSSDYGGGIGLHQGSSDLYMLNCILCNNYHYITTSGKEEIIVSDIRSDAGSNHFLYSVYGICTGGTASEFSNCWQVNADDNDVFKGYSPFARTYEQKSVTKVAIPGPAFDTAPQDADSRYAPLSDDGSAADVGNDGVYTYFNASAWRSAASNKDVSWLKMSYRPNGGELTALGKCAAADEEDLVTTYYETAFDPTISDRELGVVGASGFGTHRKTYTLYLIEKSENGTVSDNLMLTGKSYDQGAEVTVIATPDARCTFLGWFDSKDAEDPVSTRSAYTFTMDSDKFLLAKFSQPSETIIFYDILCAQAQPQEHGHFPIEITKDWLGKTFPSICPGGEVHDQATKQLIETELNKPDTVNGLNHVWMDYVLGQMEPGSPDGRIWIRGAQNPDQEKLTFSMNELTVTKGCGFNVRYRLATKDVSKSETEFNREGEYRNKTTGSFEESVTGDELQYRVIDMIFVPTGYVSSCEFVTTVNTAGVLKVGSNKPVEIIASPWSGFSPTNNPPVKAAEFIKSSCLSVGDILYVYDQANSNYLAWTVSANGTWSVSDTYQIVNGVVYHESSADAASVSEIVRGAGAWLERKDRTKPVILYGQVDPSPVSTPLVSGFNLIGSPSAAPFDASTLTAPSRTGFEGDRIVIPTDGAPLNCTYRTDLDAWAWQTNIVKEIIVDGNPVLNPVTHEPLTGITKEWTTESMTLPAGVGFWYYNSGPGPMDLQWSTGGVTPAETED